MASGKKNKDDAADLAEIRKRINEVDEQIQALINERARHAQQVGVVKGDLGSAVDYYRPEREAEVLRAVVDAQRGPAAQRGDVAALSRNHVGLPGTAGTAENRFPRARRNVHADCRLQTFRPFGSRIAFSHD